MRARLMTSRNAVRVGAIAAVLAEYICFRPLRRRKTAATGAHAVHSPDDALAQGVQAPIVIFPPNEVGRTTRNTVCHFETPSA